MVFEQIGNIRILEQHADRADQRGLAGDDVIGAERRDVAAGGGKPVDHDDRRLCFAQPHQRVVELLRARRRAARTVDVHDHRLGLRDFASRSNASTRCRSLRIKPVIVTRAMAPLLTPVSTPVPGARNADADSDHGDDREQHGEDSPHREFAPHPAAIDNGIGIERHDLVSLDDRAATLPPAVIMVNGRSNQSQLWQTAPKRRRCSHSHQIVTSMPGSSISTACHSATPKRRARRRKSGCRFSDRIMLNASVLVGLVGLLAGALERGAEDVAKRRAGIGRAVLGDRLLLLGDFERLDRDRDLVGAAVELGDAGVDLLPDLEAVGALVAAVAREVGAADEGLEIGADDLDVDAALLHRRSPRR